jgi:hypothetical protein
VLRLAFSKMFETKILLNSLRFNTGLAQRFEQLVLPLRFQNLESPDMRVLKLEDDCKLLLVILHILNKSEGQVNSSGSFLEEKEPIVGHHQFSPFHRGRTLKHSFVQQQEMFSRYGYQFEAVLFNFDLQSRNCCLVHLLLDGLLILFHFHALVAFPDDVQTICLVMLVSNDELSGHFGCLEDAYREVLDEAVYYGLLLLLGLH